MLIDSQLHIFTLDSVVRNICGHPLLLLFNEWVSKQRLNNNPKLPRIGYLENSINFWISNFTQKIPWTTWEITAMTSMTSIAWSGTTIHTSWITSKGIAAKGRTMSKIGRHANTLWIALNICHLPDLMLYGIPCFSSFTVLVPTHGIRSHGLAACALLSGELGLDWQTVLDLGTIVHSIQMSSAIHILPLLYKHVFHNICGTQSDQMQCKTPKRPSW